MSQPVTLPGPLSAGAPPLADATVLRILQALLAENPTIARECFSEALREDATFGHWARFRAPPDCPDHAGWLIDHAVEEFAAAAVEGAEGGFPAGQLSALAARVKRLRELEDRYQETLEQEKLAAMAELAAGAGHEINNPLAVICGRANLLLRDEQHPQRRRDLATIHTQAKRVHEMIADLMLFARPPQPRMERVDLAELVDELLAEIRPRCDQRQVELRHHIDRRPLFVMADRVQLLVALRAVCDNALEVLDPNGYVEIAVPAAEGQTAQITIRDNGPGIDDETRRHLFDPYYSGRSAGRGLGMGLAKCWRIVTNHGGRVEVDSQPDEATTFVVTLPAEAH